MTESNLAVVQTNQIPEGWIDSKNGKKRTMLSVGDLVCPPLKCLPQHGGSTGSRKRLSWMASRSPSRRLISCGPSLATGWHVANAAIDGALAAAMPTRFDPVREYLNRIEADESIVPADLDQIATTYLGTKDDLYDAMLRSNAHWRCCPHLQPWLHVQDRLVLKGGQNIGKSSVVQLQISGKS